MKNTLLILILLINAGILTAQSTLKGYVYDKSSHHALEEVNVLIKPLGIGSVSDVNGYFRFDNLPDGAYTLEVSMVGYQSYVKNIRINKNLILDIYLLTNPQQIGEIAIVKNYSEKNVLDQPDMEPISLEPAISHISHEDILQQGAVTLMDALKFVPGGMTETRGRKVKQFFSVRGQTYPYPDYVIDGIWQKEYQETAYFLNAANIESIELVRSASAIIKSLNPLAGVVNVNTRRYKDKETNIIAKYASLNTFQTGISHGNGNEKMNYTVGAQYFGTDGPEGRNGEERVYNLDADVEWAINSHLTTNVKVFYMGGSRQLLQPTEPADTKFMKRKERYEPLSTLMISSQLKYKPSDRLTSELQVNYAKRQPEYHFENMTSGDTKQYTEGDEELTIQQLNAISLSNRNVVRVGVLYNHWLAPEGKRYYYGKRADVHTFSGVVADQQRIGSWLLDAGIRFTQEYYKDWGGFSIEGSGGKFSGVASIKEQWQSPVWQAMAGATYRVNPMLSWHANIAAGIVTPRQGALNEEGNQPDNERRRNIDLGMLKKLSGGGQLKLSAFMVHRKDAIGYSGTTIELDNGDIMELYENTDKRNYGLEAEGRSPMLRPWLSGFANVTYMKGEKHDDSIWIKDDEVPQWIANLGFMILKGNFDGNLFGNYTGAYKNDRFVSKDYVQEFGKAPLGDYLSVDMTAGYAFGQRHNTRCFIEVNNLLDDHYQTVAGYPDSGRRITIGVQMKL